MPTLKLIEKLQNAAKSALESSELPEDQQREMLETIERHSQNLMETFDIQTPEPLEQMEDRGKIHNVFIDLIQEKGDHHVSVREVLERIQKVSDEAVQRQALEFFAPMIQQSLASGPNPSEYEDLGGEASQSRPSHPAREDEAKKISQLLVRQGFKPDQAIQAFFNSAKKNPHAEKIANATVSLPYNPDSGAFMIHRDQETGGFMGIYDRQNTSGASGISFTGSSDTREQKMLMTELATIDAQEIPNWAKQNVDGGLDRLLELFEDEIHDLEIEDPNAQNLQPHEKLQQIAQRVGEPHGIRFVITSNRQGIPEMKLQRYDLNIAGGIGTYGQLGPLLGKNDLENSRHREQFYIPGFGDILTEPGDPDHFLIKEIIMSPPDGVNQHIQEALDIVNHSLAELASVIGPLLTNQIADNLAAQLYTKECHHLFLEDQNGVTPVVGLLQDMNALLETIKAIPGVKLSEVQTINEAQTPENRAEKPGAASGFFSENEEEKGEDSDASWPDAGWSDEEDEKDSNRPGLK